MPYRATLPVRSKQGAVQSDAPGLVHKNGYDDDPSEAIKTAAIGSHVVSETCPLQNEIEVIGEGFITRTFPATNFRHNEHLIATV